MKEFPIPLVALGPGTHTEDDSLDYMPMPKDMDTYRPPMLPEPEELAGLDQARNALQQVLALLERGANGGAPGMVPLGRLAPRDFQVINQVMGEGEASAIVQLSAGNLEVRVQESVFAGVWRLMTWRRGEGADEPVLVPVDDAIEVGPVPSLFAAIAAEDVWAEQPVWRGELPPNVQNAPLLVDEIRDQVAQWRPGQVPHVVNLTLLPVSPEDIGFLDHQLGTGRVLMLSRGYGNCRISNTRLPNCWRVVYYNSMDKVILNTVEVVDMPEVAMAAPEDLRDSHDRLREVMAWLEGS
ncbi:MULTISPECIES: hydrogenase expression/formation protein [Acidovorax]|jgi:hydrogenase-1 operon protein HyaF|uniref:hydrogenase expression/formation protein n=1 Tax=Acidovorax TaxID=12916 RepID=UPI0003FC1C21|nr:MULTISPECIES: hydrogenase expression/formation protein [Acidovorax]MBL7088800.1 hydrogenase expression/formation protein [Acidovorax sp.]PTT41062.1 hydrogenase expression/formation protein [Acidovorax sp. HMWF018]WCT26669.1 hydrogenase expression/formation C-terminal domain-containing protein [Acidovorax temperans]